MKSEPSLEGAMQAIRGIPPKRWLVTAGLTCIGGLVSATVCCLGCSIRATNRWGRSEDLVTYLLTSGTYLSLILFVFSVAVFLFCLGHLLFIKRKRANVN